MQFSFFTHRHAQLVFLLSVCIIYDQIIQYALSCVCQYALSCVYVYTFFLPGTVFISSKLIKFIFILYYFFYFSMVVVMCLNVALLILFIIGLYYNMIMFLPLVSRMATFFTDECKIKIRWIYSISKYKWRISI